MKEPFSYQETSAYKKVREADEQKRSLDQHVMDATRNALAQRFAEGFPEDAPVDCDLPPYPTKSRRRKKSLGRRHSFDPRSEHRHRKKALDRRSSTTDLDNRAFQSSGDSSEDSYPRTARCRRSKSLRRRNSTAGVERARKSESRNDSDGSEHEASLGQDSLQDTLQIMENNGPCDFGVQESSSSLCLLPQPLLWSFNWLFGNNANRSNLQEAS